MKSKQNTSLMIKAIMLLLALIIMVFAASLAWFAPPDRPVDATGLSVSTSKGKIFDIAIGFKTSENGYEYSMSEYKKVFNLRALNTLDGRTGVDALADFSPIDVTGDGVTLVRPSMLLKNTDIDRHNGTFTTVTPNKEYISFDMYFRCNEQCSVYLDKESYAVGVVEENGGSLLTSSESDRKATEGDFSKDAVVGAVRVSFVNYDNFVEAEDNESIQDTASMLWLPRPDIHLNATADYKIQSWTLSTGVTSKQIYDEYNTISDRDIAKYADTYTHHYYWYSYDENEDRFVGIDANYPNTVTDPSDIAICDLEYESGGYFYGKTRVNIWIEGCDAEARRAISGGQFKINLDLAGA